MASRNSTKLQPEVKAADLLAQDLAALATDRRDQALEQIACQLASRTLAESELRSVVGQMLSRAKQNAEWGAPESACRVYKVCVDGIAKHEQRAAVPIGLVNDVVAGSVDLWKPLTRRAHQALACELISLASDCLLSPGMKALRAERSTRERDPLVGNLTLPSRPV